MLSPPPTVVLLLVPLALGCMRNSQVEPVAWTPVGEEIAVAWHQLPVAEDHWRTGSDGRYFPCAIADGVAFVEKPSVYGGRSEGRVVYVGPDGLRHESTQFEGTIELLSYRDNLWMLAASETLTVAKFDLSNMRHVWSEELLVEHPPVITDMDSVGAGLLLIPEGDRLLIATARLMEQGTPGDQPQCQSWWLDLQTETITPIFSASHEVPRGNTDFRLYIGPDGVLDLSQNFERWTVDVRSGLEVTPGPLLEARSQYELREPELTDFLQDEPEGFRISAHTYSGSSDPPMRLFTVHGSQVNEKRSTVDERRRMNERQRRAHRAAESWVGPIVRVDYSSTPPGMRALKGDLREITEAIKLGGTTGGSPQLHELDGDRSLVTQLIFPTLPEVNDGRGVMRLGTLGVADDEVTWVAWLPLPELRRFESPHYSARIYSDPEGWTIAFTAEDVYASSKHWNEHNFWTRIAPPSGLSAPHYRWLELM